MPDLSREMDPTTQIGYQQCYVLLLVGLLLRGSIVAVSASGESVKSTRLVDADNCAIRIPLAADNTTPAWALRQRLALSD